ncbi:MAG: carbamoyltransferase family protein [Longimicrobiales bacterium]
MSTYILGISALYHDSAAALIRDGEIVAAAQEERFTRRKHDPRFPELAIEYCLKEAGIGAGDLDSVVFYEKPLVKFDRLLETYLRVAPAGYETFSKAVPLWAKQKLKLPEVIREKLGPAFRGELDFVDHHEAHAASAFYPSPYEEAAILTLDAVGEWSSSSMGTGSGNRIDISHDVRFPHSLGMLYTAFTYYTGFKVNSGEYKLMGLAPYGRPIYADQIKNTVVKVNDDGSIWLDMSYFAFQHGSTMTSEKFHREFGGAPRKPESQIGQREMDLAASIQVVCEDVVMKAGHHLHDVTGLDNLVMAGGVALNCVANGKLLREGPFDSIWVQPAAGDAGGALGGALLVWHQKMGKPRQGTGKDKQRGSLLGPRFESDDIELFLDSVGASYQRVDEEGPLVDQIAQILAEEKVVGMFQGRMEFGPRALGSRSIIGDPRSSEMQQVMNLKIKFRESFRPFAPCVLREHAHEVFEMAPEHESPYMLMVAPVRDAWRVELSEDERQRMEDPDLTVRVAVPRSKIPAITHVDYSARVQTVDRERHGRYAEIMWSFYEKTGCPVIVNTSFNIRGEPIVCTPEDAFRCFMATDMDCLVLENFILKKEAQPVGLLEDAEAYRAQYALD